MKDKTMKAKWNSSDRAKRVHPFCPFQARPRKLIVQKLGMGESR